MGSNYKLFSMSYGFYLKHNSFPISNNHFRFQAMCHQATYRSSYAKHHLILPPNSYSVRCANINQLRNQNPTCVATTLQEGGHSPLSRWWCHCTRAPSGITPRGTQLQNNQKFTSQDDNKLLFIATIAVLGSVTIPKRQRAFRLMIKPAPSHLNTMGTPLEGLD